MTLSNLDLEHVLDHTCGLWDELRGERLFITGGTGFFGCWLMESLLWANDRLNLNSRVTVLTRSPDSFRNKVPHLARHEAVTVLQGDVRAFDFPAGTFSHIVHAATESNARLNEENPLLMLDTIVEGTRHTLDFAKSCGAKKFLLTSSGAIYGKQPPEMAHISEDYKGAPDPLDPHSAYGQGKRMAEHLCALYSDSSFETKIARCFAFIGPYLPLDAHFAVGNFIRDAMNGGPVVINGDGTPRRSYLYAADLAIWLWTILFKGQSCHPYNVGSESGLSIAGVAEAVANCFSPKTAIEILGTTNLNNKIEHYIPTTFRIRQELEVEHIIPLHDAIIQTIRFLEKATGK